MSTTREGYIHSAVGSILRLAEDARKTPYTPEAAQDCFGRIEAAARELYEALGLGGPAAASDQIAGGPVGTPQRLAMEAMLRTGASIGDLCRLGLNMVEDGWLTYERGKSGSVAVIPWDNPPAWAQGDELDACLAHHPHLMMIVTAKGKPRSEKAAAAWFSKACTEAGLPKISAHLFRKLKGARMKELGATEEQRMAILGHETRSEATRYSRSADLRKVITGTEVPTRIVQLHPTRKKGE